MIKKTSRTINKKMTFVELLTEYPQVAEVLFRYNIHCIDCPFAKQETIEEGAITHGISPDELIREIEKKIAEGKEISTSRQKEK